MGGGEDWYPIFREHRGQWKRYCISCPLSLQNFEYSSCRVKEPGTYLSSKIGSSATAFNLNTLALVSPESCDRMIMALSVFRLGRAPRVLSITSCAFHQHVGLSKVSKRTINSPQIQSIKGWVQRPSVALPYSQYTRSAAAELAVGRANIHVVEGSLDSSAATYRQLKTKLLISKRLLAFWSKEVN